MTSAASTPGDTGQLRALCIARHPFLSGHLAQFFGEMGIRTDHVVGLEAAVASAGRVRPDVVLCDYDLLATWSLDLWERDPLLSRTPVIAVSLTRRTQEVQLLDVNGIAGFLYLPTLDRDAALRILTAATRRTRHVMLLPLISETAVSLAEEPCQLGTPPGPALRTS